MGIACVDDNDDYVADCIDRTMPDVLAAGDFKVEGLWISKAWVTKLDGAWFMTWQTMANPKTEQGLESRSWFVYRVRRPDDDTLVLDWLNNKFEDLEKVETRRQAERIIRRNVDNPELYDTDEPDSETQFDFRRLPQEFYDDVQDIELIGDPLE